MQIEHALKQPIAVPIKKKLLLELEWLRGGVTVKQAKVMLKAIYGRFGRCDS